MAKAYSTDLRQRVISLTGKGRAPSQIAQDLDVSERWVFKVLGFYRATGLVEPKRKSPGRKPKLAAERERISAAVNATPDATLNELREVLDVDVALSTLWRELRQLHLTYKKSPSRSRTKTA